MKLKPITSSFIFFLSVLCSLLPAIATAQPLTSRSATASAYIERGKSWFAKGDYQRALADFENVRSLSPPSGAPRRIGAIADEERSRS